jgi:hypothetical protein
MALTAFVLSAALLSAGAMRHAQAALTVRATDAGAGPGETDTVEVWLEGVDPGGVNVAGSSVKFKFDTDVLAQPAAIDVTLGPEFSGTFIPNVGTAGEVTCGFFSFPGPTLTADAVLFSVTFAVRASPSSGSSAIAITQVDLVDSGAQDLGAGRR